MHNKSPMAEAIGDLFLRFHFSVCFPLCCRQFCDTMTASNIRGMNMDILNCASSASDWRDYEYYKGNKVLYCKQTGPDEYAGQVSGSSLSPYQVSINVSHPRQSRCNCPHADGRQLICKHMVALYFTAFPEEAERYIAAVEEYERGEEQRRRERYEELRKYVNSLSKRELQERLYEVLSERMEWGSHGRW